MMRFAATFAVPLTGLALILCPVAKADPSPDDWYAKGLSGGPVSFHNLTWAQMIATGHSVCDAIHNNPTTAGVVAERDAIVKAGIFSKNEARGIIYAATYAYCPEFTDLYDGAHLNT